MSFLKKPLLDEQLEAGIHGDFDRAWQIAEELARISPGCNRAAFNRAWYEMRRGDLLKGLQLLDCGRWVKAFGDAPLPTQKPIYRNENLNDKHLLLCSEGGLGDEIINVRFAKDFSERGAKVTVTCDNSLKSVFSRVEGVSAVVGHRAAPDVYHDYWVPGMSAAHVLGYQYEMLSGLPYLSSDESVREKWADYFARKFSNRERPRIGLRFYGNPQFAHDPYRRFSVEDLKQAVSPHPWINLQKEESDLELATWEDTLAVMEQLDLVITSCTSVAHASAALGKETWVMIPLLPYYVWALPGERSPWYRSVRLFRQTQFGRWDDVFSEIKQSLAERYSEKFAEKKIFL